METSEVTARAQDRQIWPDTVRVGVVGLGYVGLPLALSFGAAGSKVTGFDVDASKVERLMAGSSYIHGIPSVDVEAARKRGLEVTGDYAKLVGVNAVIICVPTPLNAHHEPDLSYVENTAHAIAPHLRPGQLIVLESTTYPGTTEEILLPILEAGNLVGLRCATEQTDGNPNVFYLAFSPEREDPGNKLDRREIPKVVGGVSPHATSLACGLYGSIFNRVVPVSSTRTAEMTKLLENIYRCVNIALVNELKLLCLRMGINIWEVIEAAKTKPFGFQPFYPGPGLGGHCIPIDPFYLSWKAREYDFQTRFIELAGEINNNMPYFSVEAVAEALNRHQKPINGAKILVLGLSYKKDIDDLRESPSLTIIELLQKRGAVVSYNDPYFPMVGQGRHYALNMTCAQLDNLGQYDCVMIVTDHSDYDYHRIVSEARLVVDTRNATKGIDSPKIVRC